MEQPTLTPEQVKRARQALDMTQSEFGMICGRRNGKGDTDSEFRKRVRATVEGWENGTSPVTSAVVRVILYTLCAAGLLDGGDQHEIEESLLDPEWNGELPEGFI